tara:strand:- start:994 stop:1188 length:195 start_codon:yes stop_codon:yes gene_type:complete
VKNDNKNLLSEPMRQKRSFLAAYPARLKINRLAMTKTPGKIEKVLAGFWRNPPSYGRALPVRID